MIEAEKAGFGVGVFFDFPMRRGKRRSISFESGLTSPRVRRTLTHLLQYLAF
jgi:hypothetical protein